jgi:hypothetical protein
MYLMQIFLPLYDNNGEKFSATDFREVRDELMQHFGGITAYARSPAHGLWQQEDGAAVHDDLVIYEVMVEELDHAWWRACKARLEQRFRQEALLIRAQAVQIL